MVQLSRKFLILIVLASPLSFAADIDAFVAACMAAGNIEQPICECTAKKAEAELSPLAFDFVVAALEKDDAATARIRGQLQPTELLPAGMFMVNGPARCAEEMAP